MKTLQRVVIALLAATFMSVSAQAETIVDGVVYPEITDLGKPRLVAAQPQLGNYAQRPTYVAQATPLTGTRSTTIAPADVRPALVMSAPTSPTVQYVPAYNQAAYGQGYTSVGAPQRVVYVQPAAYVNTVPVQQVVSIPPTVQPIPALTPPATAYNPYATPSTGVPWKPIVHRSMPANYVVGQGLIGQPKVYVPSQPVRNFLRYITP